MTIKVIAHQESDEPQAKLIQELANYFWEHGGKEKYASSLEARRANGIPDSQWLMANLMGMLDEQVVEFKE